MPNTLAAAAPAKALLGMAWAGKAAPRSTTKKPTTPAMTAMTLATIHVLVMKLENIDSPMLDRGKRSRGPTTPLRHDHEAAPEIAPMGSIPRPLSRRAQGRPETR